MRVVWLAPGFGRGHATRAAAVCRHLDDVVVVRDREEYNEPLRYFGVPYVVDPPVGFAKGALVVVDTVPGRSLHQGTGAAQLYVYRAGRRERTGMPTVSCEGWTPPGALDGWPILIEEPLDRAAAREHLGIPLDAHLTMLVPSPYDDYRALRRRTEAEAPDWFVELTEWPAIRWLRAADVVVGAAGCNLWSEVTSLGLDARWLVFAPDQAERMERYVPRPPRPDQSAAVARWVDGHR